MKRNIKNPIICSAVMLVLCAAVVFAVLFMFSGIEKTAGLQNELSELKTEIENFTTVKAGLESELERLKTEKEKLTAEADSAEEEKSAVLTI